MQLSQAQDAFTQAEAALQSAEEIHNKAHLEEEAVRAQLMGKPSRKLASQEVLESATPLLDSTELEALEKRAAELQKQAEEVSKKAAEIRTSPAE